MESQHNATRHGCCALDTLILPSESIEDFRTLEANWNKTFQSSDATVQHLVALLIAADWLYQRSLRTLVRIEHEIFAVQPDPLQWTDDQHKAVARFSRYRTANQNAFNKAKKAVEDHLKARAGAIEKEERLNIQKARLKVYQVKNAPEPTWEETVIQLRERAIVENRRRTAADYLQQQSESLQS